jgi:hypothetical protein
MNRRKFDVGVLYECVKQHNIKLIGTYEKTNRDTIIKGYCMSIDCKNTFDKTFRALIEDGGAYCKDCVLKIRRVKIKKTSLEKYGYEHPLQNPKIREKQNQTNLLKYGVYNPFGNILIQAKIKETNIKKYGCENPSQNPKIREKQKQTNLLKYGCINPLENIVIKEKMKQTNLKKYGYENAMYNSMIAERAGKNAYKSYDYIFPSGNKIRIQGYENFGIDYLLTVKKYTEEQIVTGRLRTPSLWWVDDNDKRHRHYVDIFLPHKNKCIEIKSTRTFELHKENNLLKMANAILAGFDYEIWVFDQKGKRLSRYVYRK